MYRTHPGIRVMTIACHLVWAFTVYHKPNGPELYQSYVGFPHYAPWETFGWAALLIALLLIFAKPGTVAAQWASFLSSIYFFTVVAAINTGVGFSSGVGTYTLFAFASLVMFALDFRTWFGQLDWVKQLAAHPPDRFSRWWKE